MDTAQFFNENIVFNKIIGPVNARPVPVFILADKDRGPILNKGSHVGSVVCVPAFHLYGPRFDARTRVLHVD